MITKKIKVFVAMSGGVDSSVAALLLQKQDYDLVGCYKAASILLLMEGRQAGCDEGVRQAGHTVYYRKCGKRIQERSG